MTQEEKQLLLQDLCARLPYGVKGRVYAECTNGDYDIMGDMIFFDAPFDVILEQINVETEYIFVTAIGNEDTVEFIDIQQTDGVPYTIEDFKPYLRSLSSMTVDEKEQFHRELSDDVREEDNGRHTEIYGYTMVYHNFKGEEWFIPFESIDWLNKNHFDYRGLIKLGLALEAPEGMYENVSQNT